MSTDQKEREEHLSTPELKAGIDRRATKKKLGRGVLAGASAAAVTLTAGVVYAFMPKGDTVSAGPNPSETVATGPAVPGNTETEQASPRPTETTEPTVTTEPSPADSESAPQPSATETTSSSSEFPFNEGEVAEMQEQSYARFKENPKPMRVSFFLSAAYEEVYNNAEYTSSLDQVITHEGSSGEKIFDYLPYGDVVLTRKSSAQDILNSYICNQAFLMAVAEGDPDQANKLISGVASTINSKDYRDLEGFVTTVHNLDPSETGQHRMGEKTVNSSSYEVTDYKFYTEKDPTTDKNKTFVEIFSKAGYVYTLEFYSVPEIGVQAETPVKDSGIWLLVRTDQQ